MKKSEIIFLGIIIIIAIIGLVIFWYSRTMPNDTDINTAANPVKPADKNIFIGKTGKELDKLENFAPSPAETTGSYNNEDPFF